MLAGSPLNDDVSLAAAGYAEQQFLFLVVSKPPAAAAHRDINDSPGLDESFIERQRLLMIADMEAQVESDPNGTRAVATSLAALKVSLTRLKQLT